MCHRNFSQSTPKLGAFHKVSMIACWILFMALFTVTKVWAEDDTVPVDPNFQVVLEFLKSLWYFLKDMMR